MIGMTLAWGQRAAAALARVNEVLGDGARGRRPGAARRPAGRRTGRRGRRACTFGDVTFGYDAGRPGARRLRPGARGRASRSRSSARPARASRRSPGCSLRFYDVAAGAVEIDGVDVRDVAVHDVRRAVGIVFEDTLLFHDTVAANIAFADPTADRRAHRARGPPGRRARLHRGAAGWVRHADRRARVLAVGRATPAHRHRPGDPRRPAGPRARRRHERRRPVEGARDPRRRWRP